MTPTEVRLWDILRFKFGRRLDLNPTQCTEGHFAITAPWAQLPRLYLINTLHIPHFNTSPDSLPFNVLYFMDQDSGRKMRAIRYELAIKRKRCRVDDNSSFDAYELTVEPLASGELPSSPPLPSGEPSTGLWVKGPHHARGIYRSFVFRFPCDTDRVTLHTTTDGLTEAELLEPVSLVSLTEGYPVGFTLSRGVSYTHKVLATSRAVWSLCGLLDLGVVSLPSFALNPTFYI